MKKDLVAQKNLKRILSGRGETISLLEEVIIASESPITVRDIQGNLLYGAARGEADDLLEKYLIHCDDQDLGWVSGGTQAKFIATLLTYLVAREAEKEELLDEVLDLYRQLNLLFNLSSKLAATLELETVAKLTLEEACRLIDATGGVVMLMNEGETPHPIATLGQGFPLQLNHEVCDGILGTSVMEGRAEIINDLCLETEISDSNCSLLCAPLTLKNRTMGAIIIISDIPVRYTAGDLNLLNTLATQAAPAIENALLYESSLREAREREELLRWQVQELRIELDEVRQEAKLAEITGSEYYQRLRKRANRLRNIINKKSEL